MLDLQLIPSARIPEMLAHLADLRERVARNLRDAEELQRSFAVGKVTVTATREGP
jgi:hypothetical protein